MTAPVWIELASLDAFDPPLDADDWLTPDEHARLQRIGAPQRRRQLLAGHWLARRLAARVHDGSPMHWRWCGQAGGCTLQSEGRRLSVSLSHSDAWLAVAIAAQPVGVDIELPRRQRDVLALAREIGADEEVDALQSMPQAEREAAFLRLWTLKEAHGKRSGRGLQPAHARGVAARPVAPAQADARSWRVGQGSLAVCAAAGFAPVLFTDTPLACEQPWRLITVGEPSSSTR